MSDHKSEPFYGKKQQNLTSPSLYSIRERQNMKQYIKI